MNRILVVEDDESLAMGIEYALEKEGWEVKLAGTLSEAWGFFQSIEFDLVLLDVMLPDGNGFDFCRKIRRASRVPVIFLTACDEEVNVVLGLDIGGDDYITKPFRVRELISRIRAVLRRNPKSGTSSNLVIKSRDVVLYPAERKLTKNGQEVLLTPTEFKLVYILMENAMQVLSRAQILDKLWDIEGEYIDDNTLSVHIRRLREKIEDDPSNPKYVTTVRGVGYKWNQERM